VDKSRRDDLVGVMHGDGVVKVIFNRPKRFEHMSCSRLEIALKRCHVTRLEMVDRSIDRYRRLYLLIKGNVF